MFALNLPPKFLLLNYFTGVQRAQLSGNKVLGQFNTNLVEIGGTGRRRLIEIFLNWPDDPGSIVRFTRTYGPLKKKPKAGDEFKFDLREFRTTQQKFRKMWRNLQKNTASWFDLLNELGGPVRFSARSVTYIAPTLYAYLYADLSTTPKERVRACKREECGHPYFTARHLNQEFCSDQCAEEGKRAWNKEWWQKHGQSWRAQRRDEI